MLPKNDLTSAEILSKLDQTTKKSRAISLALTSLLIVIFAVVSYLTYSGLKELNELEQKKAKLLENIQELNGSLDAARKESLAYINATKDCIKNKTDCNEAEQALEKVDTGALAPQLTPTPPKNSGNANVVNTPPPNKNPLPTVYIQITEERQRNSAKQIIKELSGGFKFPGIELVERSIGKTQVRYFRAGDEAKAKELADELTKRGIPTTAFSPYQTNSSLEIWFSNDAFDK